MAVACKKAVDVLTSGGSSCSAAVAATMILEVRL